MSTHHHPTMMTLEHPEKLRGGPFDSALSSILTWPCDSLETSYRVFRFRCPRQVSTSL